MAADKNTIRIGRVSSVNYAAGTVRVTYSDQDATVTKELPMLSDQYLMPAIGDMVAVAHISNGSEGGVVLGRFFNAGNKPAQSGAGVFRQEFTNVPGQAYAAYDPASGTLAIKPGQLLQLLGSLSMNLQDGTITLHLKTLNIVADSGSITIGGKTLD
jgi:phage baseplate assembly protein gpV